MAKQNDKLKQAATFGDQRRQCWNWCELIARIYYRAGIPQHILEQEIKVINRRVEQLKKWDKK